MVYITRLLLNHNKFASLGGGENVVASLRAEINSRFYVVHISSIYIEPVVICQSIKKGDFSIHSVHYIAGRKVNPYRIPRTSISPSPAMAVYKRVRTGIKYIIH